MQEWITLALASGFTEAGPLDIKTLQVNPQVREMCAADRCNAYNKNHTCPPNCGTLEQCQTKMAQFENGILLITVGQLDDAFDLDGMTEAGARHHRNLQAFAGELRKTYPNSLFLGAGGCKVCESCAYPEPCRFPNLSYSSMEGYGLLVSEVCLANGQKYSHGTNTVTYIGCALF